MAVDKVVEQPCPVCKHGTFADELSIEREERLTDTSFQYTNYRVGCSCGVTGPDAHSRHDAIEKWNNMPRMEPEAVIVRRNLVAWLRKHADAIERGEY